MTCIEDYGFVTNVPKFGPLSSVSSLVDHPQHVVPWKACKPQDFTCPFMFTVESLTWLECASPTGSLSYCFAQSFIIPLCILTSTTSPVWMTSVLAHCPLTQALLLSKPPTPVEQISEETISSAFTLSLSMTLCHESWRKLET